MLNITATDYLSSNDLEQTLYAEIRSVISHHKMSTQLDDFSRLNALMTLSLQIVKIFLFSRRLLYNFSTKMDERCVPDALTNNYPLMVEVRNLHSSAK